MRCAAPVVLPVTLDPHVTVPVTAAAGITQADVGRAVGGIVGECVDGGSVATG